MFLGTAAFAQQNSWVNLPTGVDANGEVTTTSVFGHYSDLEGIGEVFIECDPDTGEEIGAYIPCAKIGDQKTYAEGEPIKKETIDWDNPKEVYPLQVELMAPNIPTNTRPYWEIPGGYQNEGLTKNEFKWPMNPSFTRLIPGNDPNNWLFIASVNNPNDYSVNANWSIFLSGFADNLDCALNFGFGPVENISKSSGAVFGPNETKFVLLNKEIKRKGFASNPFKWNGNSYYPPYSQGGYNTSVTNIADLSYPEFLKKDGAIGLFYPYKTWNGTPWTPTPQIPMRLSYNVQVCFTDDCHNGVREFPGCYARMEGYLKPPHYDSVEWKVENINLVDETAKQKATTALESVFNKWGIKNVPFFSIWWYKGVNWLSVNGDTGDWREYRNWTYYYPNGEPDPGWNPCFEINFAQMEPCPSGQVQSPGDGWLYKNDGANSYGSTLTAPALVKYGTGYDLNQQNINGAWVPSGTGFSANNDVRYYDTGWMNILPVYVAKPMFIERYSFVSTAGDYGYLTKEVVPGYKFYVSVQQRPTLNASLRPLEITANVSDYYIKHDDNLWYKTVSSWKWTSNTGWQMLSEYPVGSGQVFWGCEHYRPRYDTTIKCAQTFSCYNPTEYTVKWSDGSAVWGNPLRFYWESESLENALKGQGEGSTSFDRVISTGAPESPSINPGQTNIIYSATTQGTASILKGERSTCDWGGNEGTRNMILSGLSDISNVTLPHINTDREATLMETAVFKIMGTFLPGEGGLIDGAKKNMIFRVYGNNDGLPGGSWWLGGTVYSKAEVGFPACSPLAFSSYTSPWASPTEGMILRPEDEMFIGEVGNNVERVAVIPLGKAGWYCLNQHQGYYVNTPLGARHWKFYCPSDGKVYPEPYPN